MRSRTVREGSVGFLILLGLGLFGGLVIWLRGIQLGNRSYKILVEFPNAQGMQVGTVVRYRGVSVGKISAIKASPNQVEVVLEITPANLVMPRDVIIEANKSGLIGEAAVEITPRSVLGSSDLAANPFDSKCPNTIICNNSRLKGEAGASMEELIRSALNFTNLYSDPQLFANVKSIAQNTAIASQNAVQLTRDLSSLTQSAKVELGTLSQSVRGELGSLNQSVQGNLGAVSADVSRVSATADASTRAVTEAAIASANSVTRAANQINLTASQANALLATNRATLVATLNNINQASEELRGAVSGLSPLVSRIEQGQLINNLEVLSANAAQASANLRDLSTTVNNPTNLLVLQQTLDSARATFQNVQKITSDLDELTGDPAFRNNIRRLIKGLGGLLGSTQQLQQQAEVARNLASFSAINTGSDVVNSPGVSEFTKFSKQPKFTAIPAPSVRVIPAPNADTNSTVSEP